MAFMKDCSKIARNRSCPIYYPLNLSLQMEIERLLYGPQSVNEDLFERDLTSPVEDYPRKSSPMLVSPGSSSSGYSSPVHDLPNEDAPIYVSPLYDQIYGPPIYGAPVLTPVPHMVVYNPNSCSPPVSSPRPISQQVYNCVFCKNHRMYAHHNIKDEHGRVTCPILKSLTCELCGASGEDAHTASYCRKMRDRKNANFLLETTNLSFQNSDISWKVEKKNKDKMRKRLRIISE